MTKVIPPMDSTSTNIVADNISKLKALFPEAFTEGKVDFDALKEVLGDYVDGRDERYSFTWNGKSKARMIAQTPSTGTLRPCKEESVDWDSTQNLFIEGDNLEVLKLLQKSYHKKIKMIYIDPPYNTGKDFVYKDNFKDNIKNYKEITGQVDGEGRNLSNNPETSGRYHTDWLNMMYPRLKLARNLLKDDGVIFISIDDNEVTNLRKLCDEIFGEENFLSSSMVLSNPRGRQSDTFVATVHDSLVIYCKDISRAKINGMPLTEKQKAEFNFTDEDGEAYRLLGLRQRGVASKRSERPDMYFPIYVCPETKAISLEENQGWHEVLPRKSDGSDGRWMWGKEKCLNDTHFLVSRLIEHRNEYDIFVKDYLNKAGEERTRKYKSLWDLKTYNNQAGTQEVKAIFQADVMSFPKSKQLLIDICNMGSSGNDIVMDFFAGSATTAHAVLQLNVNNNESRRFLLVQLPEKLDETEKQKKENKDAIKFLSDNSFPAALTEISKERIRRAAAKIQAENPDYQGDLGFKVFKLDSTNIKPWELDFDLTAQDLEDQISNIKPDRKDEDVLYEVLLKYGLDLTLPITEHSIDGHKVFNIGMGALIVCLSDKISLEVAEGIAKLKDELNPEIMRVVFKDAGFADDVVKTNALQILKQAGIEDVRSL